MNRIEKLSLVEILAIAIGFGAIGGSVFAYELGIDHNPEWGGDRLFLFYFGVLVVAGFIFTHFRAALLRQYHNYHACIVNTGPVKWITRITRYWRRLWLESLAGKNYQRFSHTIHNIFNHSPLFKYFKGSNFKVAFLATCLFIPAIIVLQFWLVTAGKWTFWEGSTTYTDKLARAFLEGQTHLLERPPKALTELSNPYNPDSRQGITFIWDSSLYQGRYYLYWGPVPACISALIKFAYPYPINDGLIVFVLLSGVLVTGTFLSVLAYRRWFSDLSGILIIPTLLLMGLANPLPYLLTRPSVYEVAISGGQFFLITALLWSLTAFAGNHINFYKLALAGLCAGLAVGCRANLIIPVAWLTLLIVWRIYHSTCKNQGYLMRAAVSGAYLMPLVIGTAGLAWYNLVRFGSVFETGLRYQLSNINNANEYTHFFSFEYLFPNLYGNMLRPLEITLHEFPYINAPWVNELDWPFYIRLPKIYSFQEPVTSIWMTAPFLLFALIALIRMFPDGLKANQSEAENKKDDQINGDKDDRMWWLFTLVGLFLSTFLIDNLYAFSSMRYQADFMPVLFILGTFGFWQGARNLISKPNWYRFYLLVGFFLCFLSVVIGIWMGITGEFSQFEEINPHLFYIIRDVFKH